MLDRLEAYPFDLRGTGSYLQIGVNFPPDSQDFHPLANFGSGGVWTYPLLAIRKLMGTEAMIEFHRQANRFGPFFLNNQIDDPHSAGNVVKYRQLVESAEGFSAFLNACRIKAIGLLESDRTTLAS